MRVVWVIVSLLLLTNILAGCELLDDLKQTRKAAATWSQSAPF